jgi:uridine kinase
MQKLYFDGRPAWYTNTGGMKEPYIIGIAGGSASGKTSVCNAMIKKVGVRWVVNIATDSFYKILTPEQVLQTFTMLCITF